MPLIIKNLSLSLLPALLPFLLSSCGIHSDIVEQKLNTPKNLSWIDQNILQDGQIVILFTAYNPEELFSGYQVYMSTKSESEVKSKYREYIDNSGKINPKIQKLFVIKNISFNNYPTIQNNLQKLRNNPANLTYTIRYAPNNQTLISNVIYYIGVSAYSSLTNQQSSLSQIIKAKP